MQNHYSLKDISREYSRRNRGYKCSNVKKAVEVSTKEDVAIGTLLRIADFLERLQFLATVSESAFNAMIYQRCPLCAAVKEEHFRQQMEEREKKHGPCPEELKLTLERDAGVHHHFASELAYPEDASAYIALPEKGTAARKMYDRWMKRRAPKAQQHNQNKK